MHDNLRGVRYGEVLAVLLREEGLVAAVFVKLNGPRYWCLDAGSEVHELVNPDGVAYVMQAYCVGVDPSLNAGNLKDLGARLKMPEGWSFRTRVLDEEIVVDTSETRATVLQDELENSYTLPV